MLDLPKMRTDFGTAELVAHYAAIKKRLNPVPVPTPIQKKQSVTSSSVAAITQPSAPEPVPAITEPEPVVAEPIAPPMPRLHPVETVIRAACKHFHIRRNEMLANRRFHPIARPRQIAMFVAHELSGYSFPEIGRRMYRDHTTILYGTRKVESLLGDPWVAANVDAVRRVAIELDPTLNPADEENWS